MEVATTRVKMMVDKFNKHGLHLSRMVCGSKSLYRQQYPENDVYFNANIFVESAGKVWWGDLDLTIDLPVLQKIADELGETIYVLREMDGRFENETVPVSQFKNKAVATIKAS